MAVPEKQQTIDLRKTKEVLSRQGLTHYLMQHMSNVHESCLIRHASVVTWLFTNQYCFTYEEYLSMCIKNEVSAAPQYKEMFMFEIIITKTNKLYAYSIAQSHLIDGQRLETLYDGAIKVFVMRLSAYDREHASEQAQAVAKENNI